MAGADGSIVNNVGGGTVTIKDSAAASSATFSRRIVVGGQIFGVIYTGSGSTTIIESGNFSAAEGEKYVFLNNGGTLIINGGTVNAGSSYPIYSYGAAHKLVINDVTVNATFGCVNAYSDADAAGSVEINGGIYTMTGVQGTTSHIAYFSTNTSVVINGGSFSKVGDISMSATGGGGICAIYGARVTINGGSFAGDYADIYSWGGEGTTISITGGTFKYALPANTVPEGFTAVGDKTNGYAVVEATNVTKVSEGLYKDEANNYYTQTGAGLKAFNDLLANKTAGKAVVLILLCDIDFEGNVWTTVDSHVDSGCYISEINGNGNTVYGLTINCQAMFRRFAGSGDVVIKDITFDGASVNSTTLNTSILTVQSYQNVLLDNVDVMNSTIEGSYKVAPLIATVYNESSTTVTATIRNCDVTNTTVISRLDFMATGMVAFVYESDNDSVVFENCTVTDVLIKTNSKGYNAVAAVYCNDGSAEGSFSEVEGVTVTNVQYQ